MTESRPVVIACGALAAEIAAVAHRRDWDIEIAPLPALMHNRPDQIAPALKSELARLQDSGRRVIAIAYGDCGTYGAIDATLSEVAPDLARLNGDTCYDVFAGEDAARLIAEQPGTYFLTDFLARTFEHTVVRELGLDRHPELREDYFRHYTRVVWLAQRPTPPTRAAAERAAERLGLPLEILEVGNRRLADQLERLLATTNAHAPTRETAPG